MSTLRDDEREALGNGVRDAFARGGAMEWADFVDGALGVAVMEIVTAHVAAALTKQAEDIGAAIEDELVCGCIEESEHRAEAGDKDFRPHTNCRWAYFAARIAREFGQQKEAT